MPTTLSSIVEDIENTLATIRDYRPDDPEMVSYALDDLETQLAALKEIEKINSGDSVWVVLEDGVGEMSRVLRVFDNPTAANSYVDDPDNAGHLFVEKLEVEHTND
jgi:hypothetical protein